MPYRYRTILCPIDFDENSFAALRHAANLAVEMGATLHLLHVVPIIPTVGEIAHTMETGSEAPATRQLKEVAVRESAGVQYETHTMLALASNIPRTILGAARDLRADLIVMATHGRSGFSRLLLGSVSEAVVRNAECPVLTIRS